MRSIENHGFSKFLVFIPLLLSVPRSILIFSPNLRRFLFKNRFKFSDGAKISFNARLMVG